MVRPSRAALVFLPLCLGLFAGETMPSTSASATGAADLVVVPGKRVGPITSYSSLAVLEALYGKASIKPKMQILPSGDTAAGARLFADTDRHLDLIWDEDGREKRVAEVRILGKDWALENGVKVGMTLADVEKLTGKAFHATGTDATGSALATIDGPTPGTTFGVRYMAGASTPGKIQEPIKTKAKAKGKKLTAASEKKPAGPAPAPEVNVSSNATVTQVGVWCR